MKIIRIDVDSDAMHRIQRPDLPIVARAEDALPPLLDAADRHNRKRASRAAQMLLTEGGLGEDQRLPGAAAALL